LKPRDAEKKAEKFLDVVASLEAVAGRNPSKKIEDV